MRSLESLLAIALDEVDARPRNEREVLLGLVQCILARIQRADRTLRTLPAERPHGHRQAADDDKERDQGDRRAPLRLAPRGERGHPAVGRPSPRQQVVQTRERAVECRPGDDPCAVGRGRHRGTGRLDVVGEWDRRAVGSTGERLGRSHRHERPAAGRRRHLGRLERDRPITAGALGCLETLVEVLHGRLRMERDHRILELVRTELGDDVRRDEHERVADRNLAAPHLRLESAGRQASFAMRVGQGREPGLTDEVRLGRADRRHVHLVAADHADPDADGAVVAGRFQAEAIRLVQESLVGSRDRLLQADADPGRFVVVVLVPDRLGR